MSITAERLESSLVSAAEAQRLAYRRLLHAARVVRHVAQERFEAGDSTWLPWAEDVIEASERHDQSRLEDLILEAYRRVLFERRGGFAEDAPLVRTKEDWEALPDRTFG